MNLAGIDVWGRARGLSAPAMPTHRFDKITHNFTNVVRCVDDSLLWEDDLKSMFDLTCKYISTCSISTRTNFDLPKTRLSMLDSN